MTSPIPSPPALRRGLWASALALPLLAGSCNVVDEPAAPSLCLVTVSGLSDAEGLAWLPDTGDAPDVLAARIGTGFDAQLEPNGEPRARAAARTALERARDLGFETAAFVTDSDWTTADGTLDGAFHCADRELLEVLYPDDPLAGAIRETRAFLQRKLPRPLEDGGVVWLHLALDELATEAERRLYFDVALEGLALSLAEGDCRLAVASSAGQGLSLRLSSTLASETQWNPVPMSEPPPARRLFHDLIDGLKPFGVRP